MRRGDEVLALVSYVLDWQDRIIREVAVEVDGHWYLPPWVLTGDDIPFHRIVELAAPVLEVAR